MHRAQKKKLDISVFLVVNASFMVLSLFVWSNISTFSPKIAMRLY